MKGIVHDGDFFSILPDKVQGKENLSNKINQKNNKKVLIIEDQEIAQKVHAFYLEPFELVITFAANAAAALDAIANSTLPFDLIILDIELPDINGLDLAKQLRAKNVTTPIVVISIIRVSEKQKKLLKSDIQAFYVKPLVSKQYKQIVLEFLS